jgi:hypothetical protein
MTPKRIHVVLLALLVAVLAVSLLSERAAVKLNVREAEYDQPVPSSDFQLPLPQATAPSNDSYQVRTEELLREVIDEILQIRNITLAEVKVEVVTKAWVVENWGKTYADRERTSLQKEDNVYRGFFMTSEGESLYQAQVEWAGGFVAAELGGKIYVVRENFDPGNEEKAKATLAHELTHIMQDKQVNISRARRTFDGEKARVALIEGDAAFTAEFFRNQTEIFATSSARALNEQFYPILLGNPLLSRVHLSVPESVQSLNYFPYKYGLEFIRALHKTGGWDVVNQAYANPPNSTEQILHPEKYLAGEGTQEVASVNVTDASWSRTDTEMYGEYFLAVMLAKWIPQREADNAAAGWGGDKFESYERDNESLFVWNITWDSALDAVEFDSAFKKMVKATGAEEENGVWCCDINNRFKTIKTEGQSTLILSSTSAAGVLLPFNSTTTP